MLRLRSEMIDCSGTLKRRTAIYMKQQLMQHTRLYHVDTYRCVQRGVAAAVETYEPTEWRHEMLALRHAFVAANLGAACGETLRGRACGQVPFPLTSVALHGEPWI